VHANRKERERGRNQLPDELWCASYLHVVYHVRILERVNGYEFRKEGIWEKRM